MEKPKTGQAQADISPTMPHNEINRDCPDNGQSEKEFCPFYCMEVDRFYC